MTRVIKLNPKRVEKSKIKLAARVLKRGGLVAFPTETVYGLAANALDAESVKKVFEAKGRPADNPLIVHIAEKEQVYRLAKKVPEKAEKLMDKFWPGPLTIVLEKSRVVPKATTGGRNTVAVRMPDNRIALALIREAGVPLAAPSANSFGKPSPTSAEHVFQDLCGKIDVILDGGNTDIGVESTVLDLTTDPPTLLRPGGITLEKLKTVLDRVRMHPAAKGKKTRAVAKSPGMKYKHYAPNADVILVEGRRPKLERKVQQLADRYRKEGKAVGEIGRAHV